MNNKHLYLIDGSGYIFRAYHAMPALTRKSDGLPIGAVAGFCNMLYKLLCEINSISLIEKPTHLAIIFDHSRCSFRKEIYPEYKANRLSPPDDLIIQFNLIRQAVEAFNICMIEKPGVEADDIIASYATKAANDGAKVNIISSDKDLMQLVSNNIQIYDATKDKIIKEAEVIEKWNVKPQQMVDLQALIGDSSDNIPGVKGIGPKGAAKLLEEYGSLDNIYLNIENIAAKSIKDKLLQDKQNAYLSQKLAMLKKDIDLPVDWQDFVLASWSNADLLGFFKALNLNKLLSRVAAQNNIDPNDITPKKININWKNSEEQEVENKNYKIKQAQEIFSIEQLDDLLKVVKEHGVFSFYLEEPYFYIGVSADKTYFIDLKLIDKKQLEDVFCNEAILKISYDIKSQLKTLDISIKSYHDIMLMAYVLDNESKLSLENLIKNYLNISVEVKSTTIFILYEILESLMLKAKQFYVYEFFERPMVTILYNMEKEGIKIDTKSLEDLSHEFSKEIENLEKDIYDIAGEDFNLGSPKQIGHILFDKLKFNKGKKTKTGQYSTSVLILEKLAAEGAIIAKKMLRWRHLAKLKNTYTDSLPKYIDKNSRIHTTYLLAATNTARLASTDPNLQNIPSRGIEGRKIRKTFISEEKNMLLCADYNQIELRLLTHIANIASMQKAFDCDIDIHAVTAAKIFNLSNQEITPDLRQKAKAINFGIIYGISAFGLSQQLKISSAEAQKYINNYLSEFKEIKTYMEQTKEFANKYGFVETIFGRKINFKNLSKARGPLKANLERAAINARIQGSAADVIRLAMFNIENKIVQQNLDLKMLIQVHDELVFEVDKTQTIKAEEFIRNNMENINLPDGELSVKLMVEVGKSTNWAEAH